MLINKIIRLMFLISITSLICSCWTKKSQATSKGKHASSLQRCLSKAPKAVKRSLSYCNMPGYEAVYNVTSDSDLIKVSGSMIQKLVLDNKDKFHNTSALDLHADKFFWHLKDLFSSQSSGDLWLIRFSI